MKSRFAVLIAVIIGLVVLFYFIDRSDFDRKDNAQNSRTERTVSSAETESDTVPGMESALKNKSATDMEHEIAATEEKPVPCAVPVVTREEAEKLNTDAIEYAKEDRERKEPFYRLYENASLDSVTVEGTVRATSAIPDPAKNDYDNCLYALFIELDSVFANDAREIPSEVILTVPIMKDKKINQENVFLPGDKISCTCADYASMPQGIQEIQLSDDIQSYDHSQYYALTIGKIRAFSPDGNRNFAKREITILPIQQLPKDEMAAKARKDRIRNEINRIEEELKQHGGSFEAWKKEYEPVGKKYKDLCDRNWKGWISDSFFSARANESETYDTQAYIDWILPYKEYLERNNIDLIVLRFPSRDDFAARVLASDKFEENPAWVEHYYECLKNDIEIVDPMPEMWEHRFDYPLFYFYASAEDIHPFEGQLIIAAKYLSGVLDRYNYPHAQSFSLEKQIITDDNKYYYPDGHPDHSHNDPIAFDGLSDKNGTVGALQLNTGSPFVFLSNSLFGYRAMQKHGASIPHYACYFLQTMVDWKYQSGMGNSMLRNLISASTNLDKRCAVIMVGQYDAWTGGPGIPKYFFDNVEKIELKNQYAFLSPAISITENRNVSLKKEDNGSLIVSGDRKKSQDDTSFSFEIPVSDSDCSYNTCMVRVNLKDISGFIHLAAYSDRDNALVDEVSCTVNSDSYADFFVPIIPHQASKVRILISGPAGISYAIETIELWYY